VTTYRAGNYIACGACGRLLRIEWATRSIVCSCGARITPPAKTTPPPAKA
jgi:DNA-directed RNA polymerase subunit RPC12/RpoP